MGVCRFFQQGSCRFGTKCHNEHFDVKQYLKTDIESCINSNMWRFSVYGPFKDKPNIPNFIEDQSFEEVRLQAYESRRLNCFDQFHQQYTKEVHETVNKMKAMLQMTPQIIDMMVKIYDTPEDGTNGNANANANPFNSQAASIFSKPALGGSGGNIFGNAAGATPTFAAAAPAAGSSIFGGGNAAGSGNIFGGATNTNIFQQQQQQPATGFGQQSPFAQQQQQQTSIFAQQQPQQQQQQQPQQQQQLNPFGQPPATSVFRSNNFSNTSPFGQANSFLPQQQQQQQPTAGIFAQAAAATNSGNIFTQQQQPAAAATTGFFQQPATAATTFQQQQMQPDAQQQLQLQQQQQQQLQQANNNISSIYSRLEDLTPEEIAAFKAEQFAPGQVPFKPPPRELC